MPQPQNKKELCQIVGLLTYLSKFISNFSEIATPLRKLLKEGVDWKWDPIHEKSLAELKRLVTSAPALRFFNPEEPVIVSVDTSSKGLGVVLLQNGHPVS